MHDTGSATTPNTGEWQAMLHEPTRAVDELERNQVPDQPGVYLWRRHGTLTYVGTAANLRHRLWRNHLSGGLSLAGSSLRRNVCEHLFDIPTTATSNPRPRKVTREQADTVRAWLLSCELSWRICATAAHARHLEQRLRAAYLPPLNRV